MNGSQAVCAFACSLFRHKKAIVLDGIAYGSDGRTGGRLEVADSPETQVFEVIEGPPASFTKYPFTETGPRYIGDSKCWILERIEKGNSYLLNSSGTY